MNKLRKSILNKLTIFDYLLIILFIAGIIFFAFIFFRKPSYMTAVVKVSEDGLVWPKPGPQDWVAGLFYIGMTEKDSVGGVQAEVTNVYTLPTAPNNQAVYLTLRLKCVLAKASNQCSYKGKNLLVGHPIDLRLDEVGVEGLVTSVDGTTHFSEKIELLVEAETWDDSVNSDNTLRENNFIDTTGVRPYIVDAITVGDSVKDNYGEPIMTVVEKHVKDGRRLVVADNGSVFLRNNPLLKDLKLVLRVKASKYNDKYYLFEDIPILIGSKIPVVLNNLSIFPEVTKITPLTNGNDAE